MKSTTRNARLRTPLFLTVTAAAALALSGSGCIVETGPDNGDHGGTTCYPNLVIDYVLQDAAGAPVTCAAAGASRVQANVDGYLFATSCSPDASAGSLIVPLQGVGTYYVSINVFDGNATALASPQTSSFNITSCGDTETQTPAVFVVSPAGSTVHPDGGA